MKARYLIAAAAAALAFGSAADATVYMTVIANGTTVYNNSSGAGALIYTNMTPANGFSFQNISTTGMGVQVNPTALAASAFSVSTGATGGTLTVLFSQDQVASTASLFTITNAVTSLIGTVTGTTKTYVGPNTAYSEATLLNTFTLSGDANSSVVTASGAHPNPFAETIQYDFTFGANSTLNIGTQINAAIPEPATWGLMVLGFGAIGGALRTSRRKVVFA